MRSALKIISVEIVFKLLLLVVTNGRLLKSEGENMNNNISSTAFSVAVVTRVKFNGYLSRNGFVPTGSRVKMSCEVSFQGISKDLLSLVLIGFGLPNGEHVITGNCFVTTKRLSKKCKMVMKRITMSDEGTYSCLVYYYYGGSVKKNLKKFVINVTALDCPFPKIFCHMNKKCIYSHAECKASHECSSHEFRCRNGQCIEKHNLCDDIPDCSDKSDEVNCETDSSFSTKSIHSGFRREDNFICNSGENIPLGARCNGNKDCQDNSDETDCAKYSKEFICSNNSVKFSSSNGQGLFPKYGLIISGMLTLTILMIVFSLCIKQRKRKLEDQYLLSLGTAPTGFAT